MHVLKISHLLVISYYYLFIHDLFAAFGNLLKCTNSFIHIFYILIYVIY